jgi:hypothetical protein
MKTIQAIAVGRVSIPVSKFGTHYEIELGAGHQAAIEEAERRLLAPQPEPFRYCLRMVYGKVMRYPVGVVANKFADLLVVRTFSLPQLRQIEALGFALERVEDPVTTAGDLPAE